MIKLIIIVDKVIKMVPLDYTTNSYSVEEIINAIFWELPEFSRKYLYSAHCWGSIQAVELSKISGLSQ